MKHVHSTILSDALSTKFEHLFMEKKETDLRVFVIAENRHIN